MEIGGREREREPGKTPASALAWALTLALATASTSAYTAFFWTHTNAFLALKFVKTKGRAKYKAYWGQILYKRPIIVQNSK